MKVDDKQQLILVLFLCSLGVIIVTVTFLFPVIAKVNKARLKVLSLFVDIPSHHVMSLSLKCEFFISNLSNEQNNEENEQDSMIDQMEAQNHFANAHKMKKRRGTAKNSLNTAKSNTKTFIQFLVAGLIVMTYFIVMFVLAFLFTQKTTQGTNEMTLLAQLEPYYSFAYNI